MYGDSQGGMASADLQATKSSSGLACLLAPLPGCAFHGNNLAWLHQLCAFLMQVHHFYGFKCFWYEA